jgi:hypothetical protein
MAGLQDIINQASTIQINRRKLVGVQITRNEIPRTSLTPTRNPWRFTVEMPPVLSWWENRGLLQYLDNLDRYSPQTLNFSDSCVAWIFRYQGVCSLGQINALTVSSISGTNLTLAGFTGSGITPGAVVFQPGDLIQIGANPYPFTSVNQVLAPSGNTVTFQTSRPMDFLSSGAYSGAGITVGPSCNFNVFCPNMPTYKLIPGNELTVNGTLINNARIEFSDVFELYEWVGGAA